MGMVVRTGERRGSVSEVGPYAVDLPPTPSSVRVARRAVEGWVRGIGAEPLAATAMLLVSELAANAVLHVGEPYRVVAVWRSPLFQVEVVDPGTADAAHVRVDAQRSGPGGRGLLIVDQLAHDWGVTVHDAGKAVWFNLEFPAATP
jgi:anti-sigma regulatory factor (Ser/Thr protein kinase)